MSAQYKIRISTNTQFYFILTAENNEVILTSELYINKQGALKGIEVGRVNCPREFKL